MKFCLFALILFTGTSYLNASPASERLMRDVIFYQGRFYPSHFPLPGAPTDPTDPTDPTGPVFPEYRPISAMLLDYGATTLAELASKMGFAEELLPRVPDTDLLLEINSDGAFSTWEDFLADRGETLEEYLEGLGVASLEEEARNAGAFTQESVDAAQPDFARFLREYGADSLEEFAVEQGAADLASFLADNGFASAADMVKSDEWGGFVALVPEGDISAVYEVYAVTSGDGLAARQGYTPIRSATDEEFAAMFAPEQLSSNDEAIGLIGAFGGDSRISGYDLSGVDFGVRNTINKMDFSRTNVTGAQINDAHYFLDSKLENMDLSGMDFLAPAVNSDGSLGDTPGVAIGAGTSFRNSTGLTAEKIANAQYIMGFSSVEFPDAYKVDFRGTGISRAALEAALTAAGKDPTFGSWDTDYMLFDN